MLKPNQHNGGGERVRTDDLLLAKQVLSQLSYAPKKWWAWVDLNYRPHAYQACALTKLSYRPILVVTNWWRERTPSPHSAFVMEGIRRRRRAGIYVK